MKFELDTASCILRTYTDKPFDDTENIKKLKELGFKYKETLHEVNGRYEYGDITTYRKDDSELPTIEINTIEELMDFIDKYGQVVVDNERILIYDDYLE